MIAPFVVPDLTGKTAVVTGANSGVGLWTAIGLAKAGARVIMMARNAKRGEEARGLVGRNARGPAPELVLADFADLKAVDRAGAEIASHFPALHILINNAGLFSPKRELTRDGYELTFAVNHLAPFALTKRLLPLLASTGATSPIRARIVNVASAAHVRARIDFSDLMAEKRYSQFGAYASSKLANVLFTNELARRIIGQRVTANSLHPGLVASQIGNKGGVTSLAWKLLRPMMINAEAGAQNSLYVATAPEIEGVSGVYFVKRKPAPTNPIASDLAVAARLWRESEKLVDAALAGEPAS